MPGLSDLPPERSEPSSPDLLKWTQPEHITGLLQKGWSLPNPLNRPTDGMEPLTSSNLPPRSEQSGSLSDAFYGPGYSMPTRAVANRSFRPGESRIPVTWGAQEVKDGSGDSFFVYPSIHRDKPIILTAHRGWKTPSGQTELWFLQGTCRLQQGKDAVVGENAVVWIDRSEQPTTGVTHVAVYMEGSERPGSLRVEFQGNHARSRLQGNSWYGRFTSSREVDLYLQERRSPRETMPPIYHRAKQAKAPAPAKPGPEIGQVQYAAAGESTLDAMPTENLIGEMETIPTPEGLGGSGVRFRRIRLFSRSDVRMQADWTHDPQTNRSVGVIDLGVNLIIEGVTSEELPVGEMVDLSADRMVIWTVSAGSQLNQEGETIQQENVDLEIYMEGNIVFREGERVIKADRMYYDANNKIGIVLDGEVITPVGDYPSLFRIRTEALRMLGPNTFTAENSYVTTSMLGEPSYRLQSQWLTFEEKEKPLYDVQTGLPMVDPYTGAAIVDKQQMVVAENNFLMLGEIPIFYWPWMAMDVHDPTFYVRNLKYGHDGIFGHQFRSDWNLYQIFGIENKPEGTEWDLSLDYLSDRGLGHGTTFTYSRGDFFYFPGVSAGLADFWGIYDHGKDNLGFGRRSLTPEKDYRYRLLWKHQQKVAGDWDLTAEVGKISDRDFLEQYFENEWDTFSDMKTRATFGRTEGNMSYGLTGEVRLNPFYTDTEWLPRADHYWIGQDLFNESITWYEHTKIGYAQFKTLDAPEDPANRDLFRFLDWELEPGSPNNPINPATRTLNASGLAFSTRHEFDLPINLGVVRCVPYVLGEASHWGEDVTGNDLQRLYGQAGVRASLPMWKVDPAVSSRLLYVNGLAHKVSFNMDLSFSDANQDMDQLVLYEGLDDNAIESFRRRFSVTTFGGTIPVQFDERYYALRSGLGTHVTSPSTEIADDLTLMQLGMRHRWQTKRGPIGNRRIIDWITLDTNINLYPENEQNFGETIGLLDYDFRWHVGDRFSVLSSGLIDTFLDGQKILRLGCQTNRPGRGSLYTGLDWLSGPFESTYLNIGGRYRMSEKWAADFGTSFDLSDDARNMGQRLNISRIGDAFVVTVGGNVDPNRDSWGINLSVVPTFLYKIGVADSSSLANGMY